MLRLWVGECDQVGDRGEGMDSTCASGIRRLKLRDTRSTSRDRCFVRF